MRIKGIAWACTKTISYNDTVKFFRDVLDLTIHETGPEVTVFELPNGDLFEVLGSGIAPELDALTGPKIDFLVEDVVEAVKDLEAKGSKIEGSVYNTKIQNWANYYAPDGNMYGITDLFSHPLQKQMSDRVLFYGPHDPNGYLSNWYPAALYLKERIWPTAEHYYHAQKMVGTEFEELCRRQGSPREAFEMARRPDVPFRKDWSQIRADVMREAVYAKFNQNPDLLEKLLATGHAEIIENSPVDYYWGVGSDGSGKNMLGVILMEVREKTGRK